MANLNCIKAVLAEKGIMRRFTKSFAERSGNGVKVVQQSFATLIIHYVDSRSAGCGYSQIDLPYKEK